MIKPSHHLQALRALQIGYLEEILRTSGATYLNLDTNHEQLVCSWFFPEDIFYLEYHYLVDNWYLRVRFGRDDFTHRYPEPAPFFRDLRQSLWRCDTSCSELTRRAIRDFLEPLRPPEKPFDSP